MEKEKTKQDWYCPKCQSYVSSESVTFEEAHQLCNTGVIIPKPTQQIIDEDFNGGLTMGQIITQEEKMYTEQEVLVLLHKRDKHNWDRSLWQTPKEWLEQLINK